MDPIPLPPYEVTQEQIKQSAQVIAQHLPETPMVESPELYRRAGRPVFLKCENRQRTGAFKVRGALARLHTLNRDQRHHGVVASSAGNHGLGLAWACRALGIPGLVVVPETIPRVKKEALQLIKVRVHGACYDEAEAYALKLAEEAEATFISPFDDPWVMAGNGGTVGLEILRQLPGVTAVVAPLGGGGLSAGLATACKGVPVVGVNTAASPAMARSLAEGLVYRTYDSAPTIAEGLEGGVSPASAALCARLLHGVEVVSERSLRRAVRLIVKHHTMVIEGSAAAPVAALLEGCPLPGTGPLCLVLTGRNIDRTLLNAILKKEEH